MTNDYSPLYVHTIVGYEDNISRLTPVIIGKVSITRSVHCLLPKPRSIFGNIKYFNPQHDQPDQYS